MLIRRLERVDFFNPKDGRYARMSLSTDREPRRVGRAGPEDAPFTDVIAVEYGGQVVHFLAEIVGAPGGESDMSTTDAAGLLGVDERSVRRWAKDGRVEAIRTAGGGRRRGSWRVATESVRQLMRERGLLEPGPAPLPTPPRRKPVPAQIPGQVGIPSD